MARILVVGSVNIDRVWRLNARLRDGARISYDAVETRYGGGGYYTGRTLLARGHTVRLLTRLSNDESGRLCRAMLEKAGFDIGLVTMIDDVTRPFDILVDPAGERTILYSGHNPRPPIADIPMEDIDLVYLNVQRLSGRAHEAVRQGCVVSQLPLIAEERRPAHVLLASRSDVVAEGGAFAAAQLRAGPNLRSLVLTDGAAPVRVFDANGETLIPVPACAPVTDTIGAGDVFAAGFIDAYVRGEPAADAARSGSAAAVRFLSDRMSGTTPDPDRPHAHPVALTHEKPAMV